MAAMKRLYEKVQRDIKDRRLQDAVQRLTAAGFPPKLAVRQVKLLALRRKRRRRCGSC